MHRLVHAQCISGHQMNQTCDSSDDVLNTQQILWHQTQGGVVNHRGGYVSSVPKDLSGHIRVSGSLVSYENCLIACMCLVCN